VSVLSPPRLQFEPDINNIDITVTSDANLHHSDADADPACHFDADPDPTCHFYVDPDPDPACHFYADPDPDPACHFDADPDPDPSFQIKAKNLELCSK
jgi:hypothetical protein